MASTAALRGLADEVNSRFVLAGLALVVSLMIGLQFQAMQEIRTENATSRIQVDLEIRSPDENLSEEVSVANGSTVLEALNSTYRVDYRKSSMGYYITSIKNISSNSTHFWLYFVENRTPSVGVGQYELINSSNVTFRLLTANESEKYMK
ncbi:MAG: DUF4430 domain-containing protein [Candidatus Nanohaloarchaea archaeon]